MNQSHAHVFQDVRRRRDGSIDIDFYRANATVLRNRAIREAFTDGARQAAHAVQAMAYALVLSAERPLTRWLRAGAKTTIMKVPGSR
jgi:hypothetical protein